MIFFKKKKEELYLITSFKVMFSTLTEQESLERIHLSLGLILKLFLNLLRLDKSQFYLLVRNPYSRLESFFKNKFRSTISNIQDTKKWQYCHEIFFPYIELHTSMSSYLISEKLQRVTFQKFIALLPVTYRKDGHLYPQHWTTSLRLRDRDIGIWIPIKFKAVFKMESEKDMKNMAKLFDIDLNIRENSTELVVTPIQWTHQEYSIVNRIYDKDFNFFHYEIEK